MSMVLPSLVVLLVKVFDGRGCMKGGLPGGQIEKVLIKPVERPGKRKMEEEKKIRSFACPAFLHTAVNK